MAKRKWFQNMFLEKESFRFTVLGDGGKINIILKFTWSYNQLLAKEKSRFTVTEYGF